MQIIEEASLPERPRVLVIDGLLMTAEAVVMALGPLAFAGHLVIPVTGDHLRPPSTVISRPPIGAAPQSLSMIATP